MAAQPAQPDTTLAAARYDELRGPDGLPRQHWQTFMHMLKALGTGEFTRRLEAARDVVQDNGATYNVYDGGQARPWALDIVPFILPAQEWSAIEAAVIQRATLTDRLLDDLYGAQNLLTAGVLPPHLVTGHPRFLRPLCGVAPARNVHLHLYCADLVRTPDGGWQVIAARADTPAGLGYALENRLVVAQTFPDVFATLRVVRLAAFFNAYRENVLALGGGGRPVLLTPGPNSPSYFEHVYLAHYLGLTLVQGDDLAVRGDELFLKTLTGLERVSVVFRRVQSEFCDPLELRGDSVLGVPGLVEAARAGGVVLANALGGAVATSPAMAAFLPAACRALLGEDLKIPDIATIWCGTAEGRRKAGARIGRSVLRDAFDTRPLFSRADVRPNARADLEARLDHRGETLVMQALPAPGFAPVFEHGCFAVRPLSLRVFAAWTPGGWIVMPGGLARAADDGADAASKDVWVLSSGPVDNFSLLSQGGGTLAVRRQGESAPSRALDNLFWLGRYAERTENYVRILRAVAARIADEPAAALDAAQSLLLPYSSAGASAALSLADLAQEMQVQIYSPRHERGLQALLARVEQAAWAVRDRISQDTWRAAHALTAVDAPPEEEAAFEPGAARLYLDTLVRRTAALSGLAAENMTRGPHWLFLELGRRCERAQHMAWLVRQALGKVHAREGGHIRIVLEIADSAMTYRSRYLNVVEPAAFADLLLLDANNPRACAFQLDAITAHLRALPRITPTQRADAPGMLARRMRGALEAASAQELTVGENAVRPRLVALTDVIASGTAQLSDAIADAWFQHSSRSRTGAAGG